MHEPRTGLFRNEYVRYVVFFPLLFLFVYLAVNSHVFRMNYQEMGDAAANALQIERAGQFREMLGPYSRGRFHHFGPASYYYFALMEYPLFFVKSPHGRHIIAQAILNILILMAVLHILFHSLENRRRIYLFLAALFFAYSPLGPGHFLNSWGPAILVLPMLLYVLACVKIALGEMKYLIFATIASVFIVHNHIGGLTTVVPLMGLALFLNYRNRHGRPKWLGGDNLKYLLIAAAIVLVTSIPPIIEQFIAPQGNIGKILGFVLGNQSFRKLSGALNYIFAYYANPLKPLVDIPPVLVTLGVLALGLFSASDSRSFPRYLYIFAATGLGLAVFGTLKIIGGLAPFIYWNHYSFVAIFFYLSALTVSNMIKLPAADGKGFRRLAVIGMVLVTGLLYRAQHKYDDQAEKFLLALAPGKGAVHRLQWKFDAANLGQWAVATGLSLRMERAGYKVCVPDLWLFMFPADMTCKGKVKDAKDLVLWELRTIPEQKQFRVAAPGTFQYRQTEIRVRTDGKLVGDSFQGGKLPDEKGK